MTFDVIRFLESHNIAYRSDGPNCAKGGIVIKCPFCGNADPSEHMGWDLATAYWNCWRVKTHHGKMPHKLIRQLIGCSYEEAGQIVQGEVNVDDFTSAIAKVSRLVSDHSVEENSQSSLDFPETFRSLAPKGLGKYYVDYLVKRRGFRKEHIRFISKHYDLHYCVSGYWRGRIIFPIWYEQELVGWTGRTISDRQELRYLSLGDKGDRSGLRAAYSVKDMVWNYDDLLRGGHTLVIVEGPLDALKMDFYSKRLGIRSTCLFGTGITDMQFILLSKLRERFDKLVVVGDEGGWNNVVYVVSRCVGLHATAVSLPSGVEDPGAMSPKQVKKFVREFL